MRKLVIVFIMFLFQHALIAQIKVSNSDLTDLKEKMVGAFTSAAQSQNDTSYFNIHLHMTQIWNNQKDGYWLYVEQAVASALQKPYRQRIYHLYRQDDSTLVSKVFELNAALRFAGAWKTPEAFNALQKDSLIDRQGCAIYLHKNKQGDFYGKTPGKECLSSLRGAAYATSEVVIKKDRLLSWDRGWDATDQQKWGAVKGGYEFIKE